MSSSLSKENRAAPKAMIPTPAIAAPPIMVAVFTCKGNKVFVVSISAVIIIVFATTEALAVAVSSC